jgi:hypothetical protein
VLCRTRTKGGGTLIVTAVQYAVTFCRGSAIYRLNAITSLLAEISMLTLAALAVLYLAGKKWFSGRGRPRWSRKVVPSYSRRKRPRRCSSGTTFAVKSRRPSGT